jgi:glycosyltransferase involved in cell wall biosynthesis
MPARADQLPESGVAAYTAALISALPQVADVTVLAQANATAQVIGNARVIRTWTPDRKMPGQVRRALATVRPDLLHVQHEFNLYGGLVQGAWLTAALIALRRKGLPILTTIHGVVDPREVNPAFIRRNSLPKSVRIVRMAFHAAYGALAASSDILIVHNDYFRRILIDSYRVAERKIRTIKPGANLALETDKTLNGRGGEVLTLGFLTGYKFPEVVVEVAESGALPGTKFRFCVGRNPRLNDPAYAARYAELEDRVRKLGARAEWSGYVPDEELDATFARAAVLVLPYTECLSTSGVAAAAQRSNTAICYSRALRPLFGAGPLEFELNAAALAEALGHAFMGVRTATDQFISWTEAADLTSQVWRQMRQA